MRIEGKTIIELHDAETGRLVKRTEDKNMLTNALTYMYRQGGVTNPSILLASNIRSNPLLYMLGGLMCLDTALTEDATVVRVPKGVKMVANGARGVLNNGSPTEMGSWNDSESGWMNDGSYKMVYDWSTSQGNGTIACVCLSSYYGGYCGIGNFSGGYKSGNTALSNYNGYYSKGVSNLLGIKNNKAYQVVGIRNVTEWTIKEYAYGMSETDVRDNYSLREVDSYTVQIPQSIQNLDSVYIDGGYRPYAFCGSYQQGDISTIFLAGTYDANMFLTGYVVKYNLATKQIVDVITVSADADLPQRNYGSAWGISDKWLLWTGVAVDLTNTTNKITLGGSTTMNGRAWAIDSDLFQGTNQIIDMDFEEINPCNANGNIGNMGYKLNELLVFDGSQIVRDPRYIATINNLEEPVTKDASKTMKVTYVIRFS